MPRPRPVLTADRWRPLAGMVVEALAGDRAMTLAQARRWYSLPECPAADDLAVLQARAGRGQVIQIVTRSVRLTGARNAPWVSMAFLVVDDATADLSWDALRQLAALSEARHRLRCLPRHWTVTALSPRTGGAVIPDALYASPYGRVIVEYDSGVYDELRVDAHILDYAALGPQLWVVSTPARARLVLDRLRHLAPHRTDHRVLIVRWW